MTNRRIRGLVVLGEWLALVLTCKANITDTSIRSITAVTNTILVFAKNRSRVAEVSDEDLVSSRLWECNEEGGRGTVLSDILRKPNHES